MTRDPVLSGLERRGRGRRGHVQVPRDSTVWSVFCTHRGLGKPGILFQKKETPLSVGREGETGS